MFSFLGRSAEDHRGMGGHDYVEIDAGLLKNRLFIATKKPQCATGAVGLHELYVNYLPLGYSHNLNVATISDLHLGVAGQGFRPL
jgi:hypothetical protein